MDGGVEESARSESSAGRNDSGAGVAHESDAEMIKRQNYARTWRRMALLVLAITIHNFPEGTLHTRAAFSRARMGCGSLVSEPNDDA